MKNEVTYWKVNAMKRNIMIYLMLFAGGSLILKTLNHISIDLRSGMMEIYILILSLIVFVIQVCKTIGVPSKDEKLIKERFVIYKIGFLVVLWGGIGMHFISLLLYDNQLLADSNTFTSLIILLGLIVAIMSAKKNKSYVNYKFIEKSTKHYYTSVLVSIGKLWLAAIGYATIVYSLSLSTLISFDKVLVVWSSILLSAIFFSIEYLMISIYEKIDYDEEILSIEKQSQRFLSKKVILLGLPMIGFSIISSGANLLFWNARLTGNLENALMIEGINGLLKILTADFAVIGLLLSFVIYKSIKSLPIDKPKLFNAFPALIWLNLVFTLNYSLILVYMSLYPNNVTADYMIQFTQITSYLSLFIMMVTLFIHIYMYPFIKKHHFPASKIFLIVPLFALLSYGSQQIISRLGNQNDQMMYQENLVAFIFTLIASFAYYFIYCSMSNDLYILKLESPEQEKAKVVLSKKLIH